MRRARRRAAGLALAPSPTAQTTVRPTRGGDGNARFAIVCPSAPPPLASAQADAAAASRRSDAIANRRMAPRLGQRVLHLADDALAVLALGADALAADVGARR